MRKVVLSSLVSLGVFLAVSSYAAELGRKTISDVDVIKNYDTETVDSNVGVEFDLFLSGINWDIGSDSFDDRAWTPQLAVSYGVSETLDIRIAAKIISVEDTASEDFDPDCSMIRWGFGSRLWMPLNEESYLYAGFLVNYYAIDLDDGALSSAEGMVGLSGEAGLAYKIDDRVMVRAGFQLETSILDGDTELSGSSKDISLAGFSAGIGVVVFL